MPHQYEFSKWETSNTTPVAMTGSGRDLKIIPSMATIADIPQYFREAAIRGDWNLLNPPADMERTAHEEQQGKYLAGAVLSQFGNQYLSTLKDWYSVGALTFNAAGEKFVSQVNNSLIPEDTPIYQDPSGARDKAYWGQQFASLGSSLAIGSSMIAEQGILHAVSAFTGGSSSALAVSRLTGYAAKINKIRKALVPLVTGAYSGLREAYLNGLETGRQTYEEALAKGMSEEQAQNIGRQQLARTKNTEAAFLMAFNVFQIGLLGTAGKFLTKPVASAGAKTVGEVIEGLEKAVGKTAKTISYKGISDAISSPFEDIIEKRIKSRIGKFGATLVPSMLSEGVEEGVQTVIQNITQIQQYEKLNWDTEKLSIFNRNVVDSVIGGAMGGLFFQGIGGSFNALINRSAYKAEKEQQKYINTMANRTSEDASELLARMQVANNKLIKVENNIEQLKNFTVNTDKEIAEKNSSFSKLYNERDAIVREIYELSNNAPSEIAVSAMMVDLFRKGEPGGTVTQTTLESIVSIRKALETYQKTMTDYSDNGADGISPVSPVALEENPELKSSVELLSTMKLLDENNLIPETSLNNYLKAYNKMEETFSQASIDFYDYYTNTNQFIPAAEDYVYAKEKERRVKEHLSFLDTEYSNLAEGIQTAYPDINLDDIEQIARMEELPKDLSQIQLGVIDAIQPMHKIMDQVISDLEEAQKEIANLKDPEYIKEYQKDSTFNSALQKAPTLSLKELEKTITKLEQLKTTPEHQKIIDRLKNLLDEQTTLLKEDVSKVETPKANVENSKVTNVPPKESKTSTIPMEDYGEIPTSTGTMEVDMDAINAAMDNMPFSYDKNAINDSLKVAAFSVGNIDDTVTEPKSLSIKPKKKYSPYRTLKNSIEFIKDQIRAAKKDMNYDVTMEDFIELLLKTNPNYISILGSERLFKIWNLSQDKPIRENTQSYIDTITQMITTALTSKVEIEQIKTAQQEQQKIIGEIKTANNPTIVNNDRATVKKVSIIPNINANTPISYSLVDTTWEKDVNDKVIRKQVQNTLTVKDTYDRQFYILDIEYFNSLLSKSAQVPLKAEFALTEAEFLGDKVYDWQYNPETNTYYVEEDIAKRLTVKQYLVKRLMNGTTIDKKVVKLTEQEAIKIIDKTISKMYKPGFSYQDLLTDATQLERAVFHYAVAVAPIKIYHEYKGNKKMLGFMQSSRAYRPAINPVAFQNRDFTDEQLLVNTTAMRQKMDAQRVALFLDKDTSLNMMEYKPTFVHLSETNKTIQDLIQDRTDTEVLTAKEIQDRRITGAEIITDSDLTQTNANAFLLYPLAPNKFMAFPLYHPQVENIQQGSIDLMPKVKNSIITIAVLYRLSQAVTQKSWDKAQIILNAFPKVKTMLGTPNSLEEVQTAIDNFNANTKAVNINSNNRTALFNYIELFVHQKNKNFTDLLLGTTTDNLQSFIDSMEPESDNYIGNSDISGNKLHVKQQKDKITGNINILNIEETETSFVQNEDGRYRTNYVNDYVVGVKDSTIIGIDGTEKKVINIQPEVTVGVVYKGKSINTFKDLEILGINLAKSTEVTAKSTIKEQQTDIPGNLDCSDICKVLDETTESVTINIKNENIRKVIINWIKNNITDIESQEAYLEALEDVNYQIVPALQSNYTIEVGGAFAGSMVGVTKLGTEKTFGTNIVFNLEGISTERQLTLVNSLVPEILSSYLSNIKHTKDFHTLNKVELYKSINSTKDKLEEIRQQLEEDKINASNLKIRVLQKKINILNTVLNEANSAKLFNTDGLLTKYISVKLSTNLVVEDPTSLEDGDETGDGQTVSQKYESALEKSPILALSNTLKLFFSSIPKQVNGKEVINEFGLKEYEEDGFVQKCLLEVMSQSNNNITEVLDTLDKMSYNTTERKKNVFNNLFTIFSEAYNNKVASQIPLTRQLVKEILFKTRVNVLQMRTVSLKTVKKDKNRDYKVQLLDANLNNEAILKKILTNKLFFAKNAIQITTNTDIEPGIYWDYSKIKVIRELINKLSTAYKTVVSSSFQLEDLQKFYNENLTDLRLLTDLMGLQISDSIFTTESSRYALLHTFFQSSSQDKDVSFFGLVNDFIAKHIISEPVEDIITKNIYYKVDANYTQVLSDINQQFEEVIKLEVANEGFSINSMYINHKLLTGDVSPTQINDNIRKLQRALQTNDKGISYYEELKHMFTTKNSYLVQILETLTPTEQTAFLQKINPYFISLSALRNQDDGSSSDRLIKLAPDEYTFVELGHFFQNSKVETLLDARFPEFRFANLFLPTLADKEQQLSITMPVPNLEYGNGIDGFEFVNGKIQPIFSESVLNLLNDQLFKSELIRMIETAKNKVSIKSREHVGKSMFFTTMESLNNIVITTIGEDNSEKKIPLPVFLKNKLNTPELLNKETSDIFTTLMSTKLQDVVNKTINDYLQKEIAKYISIGSTVNNNNQIVITTSGKLKEYGFIADSNMVENIDTAYLAKKSFAPTGEKLIDGNPSIFRLLIGMSEFVVGQAVGKKNMLDLFFGSATSFVTREPKFKWSSSNDLSGWELEVHNTMEETLSNMYKRMAKAIAPRNKFANSESYIKEGSKQNATSTYKVGKKTIKIANTQMQILELLDMKAVSEVMDQYASFYYPQTALTISTLTNEIKAIQESIHQLVLQEETPEILEKIQQKKTELGQKIKHAQITYPKLAGFFEIDPSDGQMFCTYTEYLRNMVDNGTLSDTEFSTYMTIFDKLNNGAEYINLKDEERELLSGFYMNALKTVYTGNSVEYKDVVHEGDTTSMPLYNRELYFKASVVPLLPHLTKGFTQIDNLRKTMEKLEKENTLSGKTIVPVTAVFGSAIKSGASKYNVPYSLFDNTEISEDSYKNRILPAVSMLDRANYGIQQNTETHQTEFLNKGKLTEITVPSQIDVLKFANGLATDEEAIIPSQGLLSPISAYNKANPQDKLEVTINGEKVSTETYKDEVKKFNQNFASVRSRFSNETKKYIKTFETILDKMEETFTQNQEFFSTNKFNINSLLENIQVIYPQVIEVLNSKKEKAKDKNAIDLDIDRIETLVKEAQSLETKLSEASKLIQQPSFISGKDTNKLDIWLHQTIFEAQRDELYKELDVQKVNNEFILGANSAQALHTLLIKECNQRGYPSYILSQISLIEENGVQKFSLPLLFSPNANQFEALLSSVISKRVAKLTLPGNGHYVSTASGYKNVFSFTDFANTAEASEIIWIKEMSGSLKGGIVEEIRDGKVTKIFKSQILIPHQFIMQNEDGSASPIDLFEQTEEGYKWINVFTNTEGKTTYTLKAEKFDPKLLTLFGIRIPTSSQQMAVEMEIVGFLPPSCGDILIVPQEHLVTLGEDFDIDKRWVLKHFHKYNKQTDKIETIPFSEKNVHSLKNSLVDVYHAIWNTPSVKYQKEFYKALSVDREVDTANTIRKWNAKNESNSFLSSLYWQKKSKDGESGNFGIGVHASATKAHVMYQRVKTPIKINYQAAYITKNDTIGHKYVPYKLVFGGLVPKSNTKYAKTQTLGNVNVLNNNDYTILDTHNSNAQCAVDNGKLDTMGAINENKHTINVKVFLTELGLVYDKPSKVNENVISLFLSQPILRRYAELKELRSSSLSDIYSEKQVLEQLCKDFEIPVSEEAKTAEDVRNSIINFAINEIPLDYISNTTYMELSDTELTPIKLRDTLSKPVTDKKSFNKNQAIVLLKFLELHKVGSPLIKYNGLLNISTKSFKSYFEVLELKENLLDLLETGAKQYPGITQLLGTIVHATELDTFLQSHPEAADKLIQVNAFNYVLPETVESHILLNLLRSTDVIMSKEFPYDRPFIDSAVKVLSQYLKPQYLMGDENLRVKSIILSDLKKYFERLNKVGQNELSVGLYNQNTDIPTILYKLFKNTENNTSLGVYLQNLKSRGINNELLDAFIPDVHIDQSVSLLKVNINNETQLSTLVKANILASMLNDVTTVIDQNNIPVQWDGEDVTHQQLAQHIILYSFMADNANGAIGFNNLIPQDVLNTEGLTAYNQVMRIINNDFFLNTDKEMPENSRLLLKTFEDQFIQNHADLMQLTKIDTSTIKEVKPFGESEFMSWQDFLNLEEYQTMTVKQQTEYIAEMRKTLQQEEYEDEFGNNNPDATPKSYYIYKAPYKNEYGKYLIFKSETNEFGQSILKRMANTALFGVSQYNPNQLSPVVAPINNTKGAQFISSTMPERTEVLPANLKMEKMVTFLKEVNLTYPEAQISLKEFSQKTSQIFGEDTKFSEMINLFTSFSKDMYIVPVGNTPMVETNVNSVLQNVLSEKFPFVGTIKYLADSTGKVSGYIGINFDKIRTYTEQDMKTIVVEELIHSRLNPALSKYLAVEEHENEEHQKIIRLSTDFKKDINKDTVPTYITSLHWAYKQASPAIKNLIKQYPEKQALYTYYLQIDEFFQAIFLDTEFAERLNAEMATRAQKWQKESFVSYIIEKLKQFIAGVFGTQFTEPVKAMVLETIEQYYNLPKNQLTESYFGKIANTENQVIAAADNLEDAINEVMTHNETIPEKIIPDNITTGSIVGTMANLTTSKRLALKRAEVLQKLKLSPKLIKIITGWEKGVDNKWRLEIADPEFSEEVFKNMSSLLTNGTSRIPLTKLLPDNSKILSYYPQLLDIKVTKYPRKNSNISGWYNPITKELNIIPSNPNPTLTFLHELQHIIQGIEGFAHGTSSKRVLYDLSEESLMGLAEKYTSKLKQIYEDKKKQIENLEYVKTIISKNSKQITPLVNKYQATAQLYSELAEELATGVINTELETEYQTVKTENQKLQTQVDEVFNSLGITENLLFGNSPHTLFNYYESIAFDSETPISRIDYVLTSITNVVDSVSKYIKQLNSASNKEDIAQILTDALSEEELFGIYFAAGGEVEARNISARHKKSLLQRRGLLFADTESISREEQFIFYDNQESHEEMLNSTIKPEIPELFESNPELANAVYEALGLNIINGSEITYTDEEGNPCAEMGLTNTVKGTDWKIVKDFKGKPKHSNGGVDITISDKGVTMRREGKDIKAKYGLLIINNN